jgi:hypothetical protein
MWMASLLPGQEVVRVVMSRIRAMWAPQGGAATPRSAPGAVDRLSAQLRAAIYGPLRPFPLARVPVSATQGGGSYAGPIDTEGPATRTVLHPRDFYRDLAKLDVPSSTLRAVHAFIATLPSWLAPPLARRRGENQIELQWNARDARYFRAVIGHDAMVIYSARLGERGRLDGAEPVGERLSPIVMHAIRQLGL